MTSPAPDRPARPTEEPLDGFMYLGEAIYWIASLGDHLAAEDINNAWDAAERTVLDALGRGALTASGTDEDGVYHDIPDGYWSEATSEYRLDRPFFTTVDQRAGHDLGGVLCVERRRWRKGIRVRKVEVRRLWSETQREKLLDLIYGDRISFEEAESWADDLGVRPLPHRREYDPIREPDWSLAMTLAWIMTQDANAVRECWDEWLESEEHLRRHKSREPAGDSRMVLREYTWRQSGLLRLSWDEAKEELWRRLRNDDLVGTGRPLAGGPRDKIPSFRWRDLDVWEDDRGRLAVKDYAAANSGYRDVAFESAQVMKAWPAASGAAAREGDTIGRVADAAAPRMPEHAGDLATSGEARRHARPARDRTEAAIKQLREEGYKFNGPFSDISDAVNEKIEGRAVSEDTIRRALGRRS